MQEGDVIDGRYRVEKKLGQGGMGQVFRGHDGKLDKQVAIKVLYPNTPDQIIKRFHAEAKALAALNHPNIMTVQDFGHAENGQLYLIMDFIQGDSLSTHIETRGAQTFFDCLPIFERICRGLRYAHMNNVLHRDIKPSNVMIASDRTPEDAVKLVDFGLAKQQDKEFDLTKPGSAMGSPPYMSPESVHGQATDARSDIYSLGCTMFEMMTGRPPFQGDTAFHTMTMHINRLAPTLAEVSGKNFEEDVEYFVEKCLKKNPDERYQDMDELIAELNAVTDRLMHRRQSSLESLASGVYASGSHLQGRMKNADQVYKILLKSIGVLGAVPVAAFVVLLLRPAPTIETTAPDETINEIVHEADRINSKEKSQVVADDGTSAGITTVSVPGSGGEYCEIFGKLTDTQLIQQLKPYEKRKAFSLRELEVSDAGFDRILSLNVESLSLRQMKVDDELIARIANMKKLTSLSLVECGEFPPRFLRHFKKRKLVALEFDIGKNNNHPGPAIAEIDSLRAISLSKGQINRSDVQAIVRRLPVQILVFKECTFSDDSFADLSLCKTLVMTGSSSCTLTPRQFEDFASIPNLTAIDLHNTNLNDSTLKLFHRSKKLKMASFPSTAVTPAGIKALKEALPNLKDIATLSGSAVEELY